MGFHIFGPGFLDLVPQESGLVVFERTVEIVFGDLFLVALVEKWKLPTEMF